jgi:hypothetical protein
MSSIGRAAKIIGVCAKTLRMWHEDGRLVPEFWTVAASLAGRHFVKTTMSRWLAVRVSRNFFERSSFDGCFRYGRSHVEAWRESL